MSDEITWLHCAECGEKTLNESLCRDCDIERLMSDMVCEECGQTIFNARALDFGIMPLNHLTTCSRYYGDQEGIKHVVMKLRGMGRSKKTRAAVEELLREFEGRIR